MAKLIKIAQRKEQRTINTLLKEDSTLTEPGSDTIHRLMSTHFPAAHEGVEDIRHDSRHKIPTSDIQDAFAEWIDAGLVCKAFRRFLPYKAAGPDGLKPVVLQHLPPEMINAITLIFQACIALKHTPKVWRDTKVIFLPKPGKPTYDSPKSYRPISLSNYLLKALERLVVWKMDEDLKEAPLLSQQHGFTKGKSTESAISNTVDYIEQQLFERSHCLGMFLDISSAFDSISIDHIRDSLLKHNGDPDLVEWYYSYLGKRFLEIELHGETVRLTTGTGFPQGGVCSARFWLIAFDEAIQIINSKGITGTGYADDCSALIGGTHPDNMIESMQSMLDRLVTWGHTCGLRFNAQKTVAVMFTRATRNFDRRVRMEGNLIPYSNSVVYLGVTLDSRLLWTNHIHNKVKKAKALLAKTSHITAAYWGPSPKLLRWAYTGIVRPVVTYAAMTWAHEAESESNTTALRRLNRMAVNTIVKVPRSTPSQTLEIVLDIIPLHLFILKIGVAAYKRLQHHIPLTWEGIFDNTTHSISHLKYWDYISHDMGLEDEDNETDQCQLLRPSLPFVLDTESFVDMQGCQRQVECNVYTDGSKKRDKVGAGAWIRRSDNEPSKISYRLPNDCSVFQAEVLAIKKAAEFLTHIPDLTSVKFFVDSQAALRAFQKPYITSQLVMETIRSLTQVRATSIVFVWTKAHIRTLGNEEADTLAKAGTELPDEDITPVRPPVTSENILLAATHKVWGKEWERTSNCRQSKLFYPKAPNPKLAKITIKWQRMKLGRYIRAISGHNNLLYHLHNMYCFISPTCRFCCEDREEFFHLAYLCPPSGRNANTSTHSTKTTSTTGHRNKLLTSHSFPRLMTPLSNPYIGSKKKESYSKSLNKRRKNNTPIHHLQTSNPHPATTATSTNTQAPTHPHLNPLTAISVLNQSHIAKKKKKHTLMSLPNSKSHQKKKNICKLVTKSLTAFSPFLPLSQLARSTFGTRSALHLNGANLRSLW